MSNMSYCRFENTQGDLRDCLRHILDDDLSESETEARDGLIRTCRKIVNEWDENEGEDTPLSACKSVLESLGAGGEQSRAFADEIATLKAAIKKAGG
jgi:hypothetical protein